MRSRLVPYMQSAPAMVWLVVFFVIPLISIASISLMTGNSIAGWDLTWNFSVFPDAIDQYSPQILRSFLYGVISTFIALVAMYPVAYWIAFHGGRRKSLFLFLLLLPFLVSFIIRILTWQFILADDGLVIGTLKSIGLVGENAHVLSTPTAVITGLTYDALPWMALPIYVAIEKIDRNLVEAAGDLYASGYQQFRRVILPLSAPGIYAGILLVGITNVGDFLSAQILGGPNTTMIGNIIQTQYVQNADFPVASALSLILMFALMLCVFVYAWVFGTRTIQEYA
ncbi:MAG: ABC transporter permease [Actinomycetota bacterium]|nr:ABC transporter permease [Actinomycetota bacterium]